MARNCRKCMICGKKEFKSEEKLFFTTFPLDENRCKEWIKVVGNPELVYLPIEKLNKVRFLCGDHFVKKKFNKKGNRLRKTAVPQLKLTLPPLTEEQLKEFPCHVQSYQKGEIEPRNGAPCDTVDEPIRILRRTEPASLLDHSYCSLEEKNTAQKGDTAKDDTDKPHKDTTAENDATAVPDVAPCDDNINNDDDDDDDVPNPPLPEAEQLPPDLFSWEKTDAIIADDAVDEAMTLDLGDVSMYNDGEPRPTKNTGDSTEYRCNECEEIIKGFRYTCVQCCDFDLCAACEACATHSAHYVLRVPGDRPYKEIQAVLAAIRHQMLTENLFLPEMIASVKEEVKDEVGEVEVPEESGVGVPGGAPPPEPDPLGAWDLSDDDGDCDTPENNPEQIDEDSHPPRKRRRTNDPLANYEYFTAHDSSDDNITTDNELDTDKDYTPSDGDQSNSSSDSDPIEAVEVDELTRTDERREEYRETANDTAEIPESDTEMAVGRCVTLGCVTEDNKAKKLPIEKTMVVPVTRYEVLRDDIGTSIPEIPKFIEIHGQKLPLKPSDKTSSTHGKYSEGKTPKHKICETVTGVNDTLNSEPQQFIEMYGQKLRLKPLSHTRHRPNTGEKISHKKVIGSQSTGAVRSVIGASGLGRGTSSLGTGTGSLDIRTSSLGTGTSRLELGTRRTKRYKIRLPPGAQWKPLLNSILNTKATVQLEDVIQKKSVPKTTEINKI